MKFRLGSEMQLETFRYERGIDLQYVFLIVELESFDEAKDHFWRAKEWCEDNIPDDDWTTVSYCIGFKTLASATAFRMKWG